ncbi:aggregation factor core [Shimia sp.]|uniref:aggregation factor core n=1 Tax=Shimia sp. TaxID=1954381 RepID=UPI003BA9035B
MGSYRDVDGTTDNLKGSQMFHRLRFAHTIVAVTLITTPVHANLSVRFVEGAPKDRFEIKNEGDCVLRESVITLDMSTSQGALIFDVADGGAGVEVFQPFEVVTGKDALASVPAVMDGQNAVDLRISKLSSGDKISFTTDVDDTLGAREITVSGSEIADATVTLTGSQGQRSAQFDTAAKAWVVGFSC